MSAASNAGVPFWSASQTISTNTAGPVGMLGNVGSAGTYTAPKTPQKATDKQKVSRKRNHLKFRVSGHLSRAMSALEQNQDCLTLEEKVVINELLEKIQELNKNWKKNHVVLMNNI